MRLGRCLLTWFGGLVLFLFLFLVYHLLFLLFAGDSGRAVAATHTFFLPKGGWMARVGEMGRHAFCLSRETTTQVGKDRDLQGQGWVGGWVGG